MRSPFKFLDSYTLSDRKVFFGRDKEIEELYKLVYRNPLTLVYGLSGTGKTSLINCGLASKFDGPDWFPLFVRRGKNLNEALEKELEKVVKSKMDVEDAVEEIFDTYLRPVYLIFDQFEELFVLGNQEEIDIFINTIKNILEKKMPCRIILIMREEYLGNMYDFEKEIPYIFDNRLRVEVMNQAKVGEVLNASFGQFNIHLEEPQEDTLQQIIDNISLKKSGVQLPYLQVYLDMLYREDFKRTYNRDRESDELPKLEITQKEVEDFGKIDDVLDKYLEEQYSDIPSRLGLSLKGEDIKKILDIFVSDEGTKIPIPYEIQGENKEISLSPAFLNKIDSPYHSALSNIINEAEKSRILRVNEEYIELAHDSLAKAIDDKRSDKERQLNEIRRSIKSNYVEYKKTGQHLSQKQLNFYEEWLPLLSLDAPINQFIEESKVEAEILANKDKRQQQIRLMLLTGIAVVSIIAALVSLGFYNQAIANEKKAEGAKEEAVANANRALDNEKEALQQLKKFKIEKTKIKLEDIRNYLTIGYCDIAKKDMQYIQDSLVNDIDIDIKLKEQIDDYDKQVKQKCK